MNVENRIKADLLMWPYIFTNRLEVLKHLFLNTGNGYEWYKGELVPLAYCSDSAEPEVVPTIEDAVQNAVSSRLGRPINPGSMLRWARIKHENDDDAIVRDMLGSIACDLHGIISLIFDI